MFTGLSADASIGHDDRIIAVEPEYFSALNDLLGGDSYDDRTMGKDLSHHTAERAYMEADATIVIYR